MTKAYFGHPRDSYNSEKELELINIIAKHFPSAEIVNPNLPEHQTKAKEWKKTTGSGINYFYGILLPQVDFGIFLAYQDNKFGIGVYAEAEFLAHHNKPIYEISIDGDIKDMVLDNSRCLTRDETRRRNRNFKW